MRHNILKEQSYNLLYRKVQLELVPETSEEQSVIENFTKKPSGNIDDHTITSYLKSCLEDKGPVVSQTHRDSSVFDLIVFDDYNS